MAVVEYADERKIIPWGDMNVRLIELNTLIAMAKVQSGMAHRYHIEKTSNHRVRVTYSNPDEWGHEYPLTAFFPCFKGDFSTWWVVIQITKVEGGRDEWERDNAEQLFFWMDINEKSDPNKLLEKHEVVR